ncbi:MAG: hypothetical protein IJ899_00530 [Blautia sp.]|nr:hypothetical protein [Blautia sp.]
MTEHRTLSKQNKYYLPKETFLTVIHYCKQYPEWEAILNTNTDTVKAITYDKDRVQTSFDSDATADLAIRRAEISRKKDMIDQTAKDVGGSMWKWLILGVCFDSPYYRLAQQGIPCGKTYYYQLRRRFYYELAQLI